MDGYIRAVRWHTINQSTDKTDAYRQSRLEQKVSARELGVVPLRHHHHRAAGSSSSSSSSLCLPGAARCSRRRRDDEGQGRRRGAAAEQREGQGSWQGGQQHDAWTVDRFGSVIVWVGDWREVSIDSGQRAWTTTIRRRRRRASCCALLLLLMLHFNNDDPRPVLLC